MPPRAPRATDSSAEWDGRRPDPTSTTAARATLDQRLRPHPAAPPHPGARCHEPRLSGGQLGWWRRRRLRRRIGASLVVVALLAGAATTADAERRRAAWGERVDVVTVERSLPRGHELTEADLAVRGLPAGLVPDGALVPDDDGGVAVVGRRLTADVAAGEVLLDGRVAPGGLVGRAALVPPGARAVAIPWGPAGGDAAMEPGMRVDLVALGGVEDVRWGSDTPGRQRARVVAEDVEILDADEDRVTVLVPTGDATEVAVAAAHGGIVPLLRGG